MVVHFSMVSVVSLRVVSLKHLCSLVSVQETVGIWIFLVSHFFTGWGMVTVTTTSLLSAWNKEEDRRQFEQLFSMHPATTGC